MAGPRRSGNTITDKLRDCLPYIAQGMTDEQIAENLGIGIYGVRNRRYRIMKLIKCKTRDDLVAYAKKQ